MELVHCHRLSASFLIVCRTVNIRWWQQGGGGSSFALDDVYIGVACPKLCQGHGTCREGRCFCDSGYKG